MKTSNTFMGGVFAPRTNWELPVNSLYIQDFLYLRRMCDFQQIYFSIICAVSAQWSPSFSLQVRQVLSIANAQVIPHVPAKEE